MAVLRCTAILYGGDNKKMKLSFIVPVYNVEAYLKECLDSIVGQMSDECEIILIDDGSPDSSGSICEEYASRYKNITVIHQENKGLSGARNSGLKKAKGEFLVFVDSDDRISNHSVERMLAAIGETNCDMYFLQVTRFYPDGKQSLLDLPLDENRVNGKSKSEVIDYLASQNKYPGASWSKIYKRSFLEKNHIFFPADRRLSEDLGFTRQCLLAAESFGTLNFPYYEYRQSRIGSITTAQSFRNIEGLHLFIEESVEELCVNRIAKGNIESALMSFVAYEYAILMNAVYSKKINDDEFILKYQWVLQYSRNRRLKVIYMLSKVLGIKQASRIIHAVKRVK